jgi:hypothetical protein
MIPRNAQCVFEGNLNRSESAYKEPLSFGEEPASAPIGTPPWDTSLGGRLTPVPIAIALQKCHSRKLSEIARLPSVDLER